MPGQLIRLNGADNVTIDGSYNGTTQSLTFTNNNASISNNTIALSATADNNTIKNCRLYSKYRSITTTAADNTLIEGNDIFGDVLGNTLTTQSGIYLYLNTTNAKVRRNNIHDIYSTNVNNGFSWGICYRSGSTTETEISNNVIYAIKGVGTGANMNYPPSGICIYLGGNIKIFNNTIYLSGNLLGVLTSSTTSSCIYIVGTATNLDIRNNILFNEMGRSPTSTATNIKTFQIYSAASKADFTNINANDYYFTDQPDVFEYVGYLTGLITNLDNWKTATGQDAGSYSTDPHFTSATNLKPIAGNFLIGENIAAITTDYEGVTRNNPPHIGAYEGNPGVWLGGTSTDWATPGNWGNSLVPVASDNVTISAASLNMPHITSAAASPAVCNNLTIESGAVVTVEKGKAMTVGGTITNTTAGGVVIESDATGTGSLIMGAATGTGTTVAKRYVTGNATAPYPWHIISSPVTGQELNTSFMTAAAIASNAANTKWGFGEYNEPLNVWNYFAKPYGGSGDFTLGKGYMMASTVVTGAISFTGTPQADNKEVTLTRGSGTAGSIGWNAIGNPFTSSISVADFFTSNGAQLDASYGALYVWNPVKSGGADYEIITAGVGDPYIPVGQGFCVNAASNGVTINFLKTMRTHQPTATFKSGTPLWPGISLKAEMNDLARTTVINFNSAMTPGLDRNYDAGLFKSGSGLDFYTRLVQNNGIDFGIQCLPDFGFDEMVISLGLDRKAGGEVTFTAVLTNLPSGCQPVLEDRQLGKRIDLSKAGAAYKVTLPANAAGTGRFYLHLSGTTGIPDAEVPDLKVYSVDKEIHIEGTLSGESIATLYDLTGKSVGAYKLKAANTNILKPVGLTEGIYLLRIVENNEQKYAGKINLQ